MWLVRVLRPRRIVELGTHHGYSYFSFCQAVLESGLDTNCFAVDTWSGDEHAGHYDEDVYRGVLANNGRYAHFSRLLRKTFDSALADIEDGSVDLLHIDGRHFYDDVKGDFESWLPKLSSSAVVVFHDVEVRERGFGVHKFWSEVSALRPSFYFRHGYGLGVTFWGEATPRECLDMFFTGTPPQLSPGFEDFFRASGDIMKLVFEADGLSARLSSLEERNVQMEATVAAAVADSKRAADERDALDAELLRTADQLRSAAEVNRRNDVLISTLQGDLDSARDRLAQHDEADARREQAIAELCSSLRERSTRLEGLGKELAAESDAHHKTKAEKVLTERRLSEVAENLEGARRRFNSVNTETGKLISHLELGYAHEPTAGLHMRVKWYVQYLMGDRSCRFADFKLLKGSPFFNEQYYRAVNRSALKSGTDPVSHYITKGFLEGRSPSPHFSESAYGAMYPDVKAASIPGLLHYERFGRKEGRRVTSLAEELVHSGQQHESQGEAQRRIDAPQAPAFVPPIESDSNWKRLAPMVADYFDPHWYKKTYRDLGNISDKQALKHFVNFGSSELRNPNARFDARYYRAANPDTWGQHPLAHYLLSGRSEGRQPKVFGLEELRSYDELLPKIQYRLQSDSAATAPQPRAKRVCCLVHIYYTDLTDELLDYVDNISEDKDVYVNLVTTTWSATIHEHIVSRLPNAIVIISPDHGRDIGGFARLLSVADVSNYDLFLLLHSKKSPHLPPEFGREWRRGLLEPVVGSRETASLCIFQMRLNPRMGLVGAAKWRCTDILANSGKYDELLDIACVAREHRQCDFVSGTMFFVAQPVIKRLQLVLRSIVFEDGHDAPLSFHVDGQYAHAVERVIANLVRDEGMFIWYK